MKQFFLSIAFLPMIAVAALAQTGLTLQGANADADLPVEVSSDSLTVDQQNQSAVFNGNAKAMQGDLVLEADNLTVRYSEDSGDITSVTGTGNVRFSNGVESAASEKVAFDVSTQILTMTGAVIMRQGQTRVSANTLILNLATNDAELNGNVRTQFVPRN
ncbi:MAG: lipopolysaccharide transport periplasmic protein LptA [Pseudomonadota bacterium]